MKKSQKNTKALVFAGMGFELVGLILAGLYLGQYLDKNFGFGGLGTAAMAMLVLASWIWHLVILLKKFNEDDHAEPDSKP